MKWILFFVLILFFGCATLSTIPATVEEDVYSVLDYLSGEAEDGREEEDGS